MVQSARVDRLHHMMVDAHVGGATSIFGLSPPGEGYQQNIAKFWRCANAASHFVAVDDRHSQIEQDHRRYVGRKPFEGRRTVVGCVDTVSFAYEQHRQHLSGVDVVVDHKNRFPIASALSRIIPVGFFAIGFTGGVDDNRHANREFASLSQSIACRFDRAAMKLDEPADERQSNSHPAVRSPVPLVDLDEHVKHFGEHHRIEPDAGVAHFEDHQVFLARP